MGRNKWTECVGTGGRIEWNRHIVTLLGFSSLFEIVPAGNWISSVPGLRCGEPAGRSPVPWFQGPEDDLVYSFLLKNSPRWELGSLEQLPEHGRAAGVFKLGLDGVLDEVEKRSEAAIAGSLG